ncbi:hypothetical protein [Saccharothrix variisporea]|uniref:hypothetical protein n=1 Tax=Saccharothrix variisporea TaxID=543527 RepID=UPI001476E297|nr:hypothetical protein [Saccharothrix variisporea]
MKELGLDVDAVPGLAGITGEVWDRCRAGGDITMDTARALAGVFGTNVVEFMVATGMIPAEEVPPGPDSSLLTTEELYVEFGRRLQLA